MLGRAGPYPWTRLSECPSTSTWLEEGLAEGRLTPPHLVTAERQTHGRGSRGRSWTGLDGNLFFSLALPEDPRWDMVHLASYAVAVAVADSLASLLRNPGDLRVKWPNDLTIKHEKVAGILITRAADDISAALVIGLGVNAAAHPADTPYPATDLSEHMDTPPSLDMLTERIADHMSRTFQIWSELGFDPIRQRYLALGPEIGTLIRFRPRGADERIEGRFEGIARDGALLLHADGATHPHYAGDLLR